MPDPTPPPKQNPTEPSPSQKSGNEPQKELPKDTSRRPAPVRASMPWWIFAAAAVVVALVISRMPENTTATIDYSAFLNLANKSAFKEAVEIEEGAISGTLKDGALKDCEELRGAPAGTKRVSAEVLPGNRSLLEYKLDNSGVLYTYKTHSSAMLALNILMYALPFLLIGGIIFMNYRAMKGGGGGPPGFLNQFSRSRHKLMGKEQSRVRLCDVAGIEEAKDEVTEIITFLKDPKKFQRLGGRVPRGVLLTGAPGCGKTLLAKAVAGEADVPFFSLSGSDFVEMFVGVGASRVRDLFKQAKEQAPCIIFLDEIDAVGRKRGAGMSGGHDERDQTLNAILVEMDGFESSDQVIVIAATNRVDVLDAALTRPGRFDRTITVPLPDVKGRTEILAVHARKIKMSPTVDLEQVARGTPGFSGAELEALINEAAIAATLQDKESVEQADFEEARDKVRWGRAKKSRKVEAQERILVAYHEAGHAVVSNALPDSEPLHKVTIIPRGDYGGATFYLPKDDRTMTGRKKLLAQLRTSCGGRIAEMRQCGDMSVGASGDILAVSAYARRMVRNWGMSEELGFVSWDLEDRGGMMPDTPYSNDTARKIDEAVRRLVDEAYRDAERILDENWQKVDDLAKALLEHETLTAEECKRIFEGQPLGKTSVSALLALEAQKAAEPPKA